MCSIYMPYNIGKINIYTSIIVDTSSIVCGPTIWRISQKLIRVIHVFIITLVQLYIR